MRRIDYFIAFTFVVAFLLGVVTASLPPDRRTAMEPAGSSAKEAPYVIICTAVVAPYGFEVLCTADPVIPDLPGS